ncbi:MAG TPA: sugar phosphate isomerase/epimerase [Firmicutes bacterium]|nr:sugar phosphate isomerase/epimerase [Bacillota bacterium]
MSFLVCSTLPYGKYDFERALQGIKKAGYSYVGLGISHAGTPLLTADTKKEKAAQLAEKCKKYSLEPVCMFAPRLVTKDDVAAACQVLDLAREVGLHYIISAGVWGYKKWPDEPFSAEEMAEKAVPWVGAMKEVAAHAGGLGLTYALKPHTGNTATAAQIKATLDAVDSPAVRACADPGNLRFYEGIDAEADTEALLPYLAAFVAKDHRGNRADADFPPPGEGDIDFVRLFKSLANAGYEGPVIVERVDGDGSTPLDPPELDARVALARENLLAMAKEAGLPMRV